LDRRAGGRDTPDRRRGDRRKAATVLALGVTLLAAGAGSAAADIYTRRSDRGVLEATNVPSPGAGFALKYRSKGRVIHSAAFRAAPPRAGQFESFIQEASAREGVNLDLVRAIIQTESAYDHLAVSSAGARGLMQLMPDTARRFAVQNVFDPWQNIQAGVRYLRVLLRLFKGDVVLAAAAYNAGEGAVMRHRGVPPYRETLHYVRKIQALLARATALPEAVASSQTPPRASAPTVAGTPPARTSEPAKPRILYRWRDAAGIPHLTDTPPDGIAYTTLRSST
jgi:hypothetical protein